MKRYKVVSELRTHGQLIDIPDHAQNVTVEPTPRDDLVRVTYLKNLTEVPFQSESPRPLSH